MKTSELLTVTFIALGMLMALGLMSMTKDSVTPVFYECGVTGGC